MELNMVALVGFVGDAPCLRHTQAGNPELRFQLALHTRRPGRRGQRTTWVECLTIGPLAETLPAHLTKGCRVFVMGALQNPLARCGPTTEGKVLEVLVEKAVSLDSRKVQEQEEELSAFLEPESGEAPQGGGEALDLASLSEEDRRLVERYLEEEGAHSEACGREPAPDSPDVDAPEDDGPSAADRLEFLVYQAKEAERARQARA